MFYSGVSTATIPSANHILSQNVSQTDNSCYYCINDMLSIQILSIVIISSAVSFRSTSERSDFQRMHLLLKPVVQQYFIDAVYFQKCVFLLVRSGFTLHRTWLLDHTRMTGTFKGYHCSLVAFQIVLVEAMFCLTFDSFLRKREIPLEVVFVVGKNAIREKCFWYCPIWFKMKCATNNRDKTDDRWSSWTVLEWLISSSYHFNLPQLYLCVPNGYLNNSNIRY